MRIFRFEKYFLLTSRSGAAGVQHLHVDSFEYFHQLFPQLLIALINIAVSHDVERGPHQSKQSRIEVDRSISVEPHVHGDKSLAGHAVGTQLAKAERRRDLPQQSHHVHVFDPSLGVRVVLRPQPDKFIKMVRAQDGPVACQVVEVVHDDGHEEVEDEEAADDEE